MKDDFKDEAQGLKGASLIPAQRRALIIEFIRRQKTVSVQQIMDQIGASQSTVRRDLQDLTDLGYLEKTRGGAMLRERARTMFEPDREMASHFSQSEKAMIAQRAAMIIEEGQSVIFDSSSTVLEVARVAARRSIHFTAVTNDLGIAREMADFPKVGVIMVGGSLRPSSLTLTGEPATTFLRMLSVDVAFLGVHSLAGLRASETSLDVAGMKRAFIQAARKVVLVVDSGKFEVPAFCEVCNLEAFSEIITDEGISAEDRRQIEERGIALTCVSAET